MSTPPPSPEATSWRSHLRWLPRRLVPAQYDELPDTHPVKIAARTYGLALSLSLAPAILPQILSGKLKPSPKLRAALARELSITGFPTAMVVALGGGAALEQWWTGSSGSDTRRKRDSLVAHALSSALAMGLMDLQRKASTHGIMAAPRKGAARSSPTLDLTLLLLVRALDSAVQGWIRRQQAKSSNPKHAQRIKWLDAQLDGLLFWLCSTRIMWSFLYAPERLPRSYVRWINALARIDPRLLLVLRAVKDRKWVYGRAASPPESELITSLATSMGLPAGWGNPHLLPGHSGPSADVAWAKLGVTNRSGVGGLPCELIHGSQYGSSCTYNATARAAHSFFQALAIYAPVHALPVLLAPARRARLLANPSGVLARTALNATRSAAFLSTFIGLIWVAICAGRTVVVPRVPGLRLRVGHQFLDGPYGAILAGCAACGASIFIETPGRRGEIALYVMPRAVRSLLPGSWLARDNRPARLAERTVAVISLAWLAMAATHDSGSLRGLSRWALTFIYRGRAPNGAITPKGTVTPAGAVTPKLSEVEQPALIVQEASPTAN